MRRPKPIYKSQACKNGNSSSAPTLQAYGTLSPAPPVMISNNRRRHEHKVSQFFLFIAVQDKGTRPTKITFEQNPGGQVGRNSAVVGRFEFRPSSITPNNCGPLRYTSQVNVNFIAFELCRYIRWIIAPARSLAKHRPNSTGWDIPIQCLETCSKLVFPGSLLTLTGLVNTTPTAGC